MTAVELRTEITRLLSEERNTSVLEAIRMLLRREDPDEDFSPEERAELDAEHERALRGEGTTYTPEQVKEMARQAMGR
ncbi:MAG TPA: hypothetical protein PLV08_02390 [Flavobacteriales bacterium]|jgi:hypothetical protein|nr:hypothetical protein [Flavobacteriales bacterium]MBK7101078.1 hypothetical protein [Flavobacteriales bacterium]MBK7111795.1 hypothetical protein [Flavobacteriales bacterium]MBK8531983.1 hypothetical protein [Flavobacteriales bacterium]MBK8707829.1 hypothetical protein [Flavobacteriales bacterium]